METKRVELCIIMDLVNMNKYLIKGCKGGAARLFSVISSEWTTGSGHKLKYKKFHLDTRKNLFTVKVSKD